MCRSRFTCTRQPGRCDVQPESQARVAIVTRQPDRYDVQPESQARVAIVTRQPDRYDVQPETVTRKPSTPALSSDARILTFRYIASLPKSTTNWTAPPDSHNQGWTGHRAYRAMLEGPMHIFGPPPPSVEGRDQGRAGHPAVILYLRPPTSLVRPA